LQELLHLIYLLNLLHQDVLCHLRQLRHVLPLVNQVVGFAVDEEACAIEVGLRDEEQRLLEVVLLVKNLTGYGVGQPHVSDLGEFRPVLVFSEKGADQHFALLHGDVVQLLGLV